MQSSSVIRNSTIVIQWWFINNMVCKTFSLQYLNHRNSYCVNNKVRCNNINLQSVKSVLNSTQWLSSVLSGVSTNKAFKRDAEKAPRPLT